MTIPLWCVLCDGGCEWCPVRDGVPAPLLVNVQPVVTVRPNPAFL